MCLAPGCAPLRVFQTAGARVTAVRTTASRSASHGVTSPTPSLPWCPRRQSATLTMTKVCQPSCAVQCHGSLYSLIKIYKSGHCKEVIKRIEKDVVSSNENCYQKKAEICGPVNCKVLKIPIFSKDTLKHMYMYILLLCQVCEYNNGLRRKEQHSDGGPEAKRVHSLPAQPRGEA